MPVEDVTCAGCGLCCKLLVVLTRADQRRLKQARVFSAMTEEVDPDVIPKWMKKSECVDTQGKAHVMCQHSNGACVALDPQTRLCSIYACRPDACRTFEYGGEHCRDVVAGRSWVDVSK